MFTDNFSDFGFSDDDSPIRGEKEKQGVEKVKRKKETSSSESESGFRNCKSGATKIKKNTDNFDDAHHTKHKSDATRTKKGTKKNTKHSAHTLI